MLIVTYRNFFYNKKKKKKKEAKPWVRGTQQTKIYTYFNWDCHCPILKIKMVLIKFIHEKKKQHSAKNMRKRNKN